MCDAVLDKSVGSFLRSVTSSFFIASLSKLQMDLHPSSQEDVAARVLQTHYRKYQHQREQVGLNLTASARWHEAIKQQRRKSAHRSSIRGGENDPLSRWNRAALYTSDLVDCGPTSPTLSHSTSSFNPHPSFQQKTMDPHYWLEMVDLKHRYGANLKAYHAYWNENYHGEQNFFYWLDHGEGRDLDLPDSPRHRLDSEKITYLTIEQRRNYLVKITADGKLAWAKDGRLVDTAYGRHKDLGNGLGIVDATEEEFQAAKARGEIPSSDSDSSFSSASSTQDERAHHYTRAMPKAKSDLKSKLKLRIDPKAIMDNLLRQTLNTNTWIFVADRHANLYIGIKQTGKFQHSSFLGGSHVLAAGLIKVNQGQLTSLSPLSGHYRAGSNQFKTFVHILEHQLGCDVSRVSISKSLFIIGALEKYAIFTKKKEGIKARIRGLFKHKHTDPSTAGKNEKHHHLAEAESQWEKAKAEWQETIRVNRLARAAADAERERIKKQGGLDGRKLKRDAVLGSLPYEGKKIEEMSDDERIERGAALIARAMARPMKNQD
ncbi:hypothetical protein O181_049889 [Austropuccinia psidii MF-1]|uniref:Uncharacterized protein n=1 Tax=Austropuccinia psidii MF-1 TaxID=1389203 RepID=A0A9Q3HP67_9BASI|nr:hypothetical protein [Austropuccinia psidii MF-1]